MVRDRRSAGQPAGVDIVCERMCVQALTLTLTFSRRQESGVEVLLFARL